MHRSKQIIVVVLVVVLMGALLAQPIKGLVKNDTAATGSREETAVGPFLTYTTVSESARKGLSETISNQIAELEKQLAAASQEERLAVLKSLAERWDEINKPGPLAFTYEEIAAQEPAAATWLKAGDAYTEAGRNLQDTAMAREFHTRSVHAYKEALALQPDDAAARTGLGVAYVSGGANPMEGISLLLEVVKEDPKNLKANKSLGLFSMQSRQFDKAIDRFKTVLSVEPDPESWFYLATSYENIGLKREAIEAYEKSKQLAADPSLSRFIDRKVEELSK